MEDNFTSKFEYEKVFNPMSQFEIHKYFDLNLFGFDISFTNSSLIMIFSAFLPSLLIYFTLQTKENKISKIQFLVEKIYIFTENIVIQSIGYEGKKFTPLILTLILYIAILNLLGIFLFSPTSHIAMTISMGMVIFAICIYISLKVHKVKYFSIFIPSGVPLIMQPLIFIIELFSYFSRPFSLGLRLAANIIAGHVMISVVANFISSMGIFGVFPILFIIGFSTFECGIGLLQAYVFALLSSSYIGESCRKNH